MFYRLYWKFIRRNWRLYIIYFLALIAIPLSNTAMPHYYGEILSSLKSGKLDTSKALFLTILAIWTVVQVLNLTNSFLNTYLMPKFQSFIRQYFFNKIIDSYSQEYKELELGKIISKMVRSPGIIQSIFVNMRDFVFKNSLLIGGNLIYLSMHHWSLGAVFLCAVCIMLAVSYWFFNTCNKYVTATEEAYDDVHEQIDDTLSNLLNIYTCQKADDEKARVGEYNKTTSQSQVDTGNCNNKFRILYSILYVGIFVALNYTAYRLFLAGKLPIKALASIFIINFSLMGDLESFYGDAYTFMNIYTKVEHITEFIDSLPVRPDDAVKKVPNPSSIRIQFKNISYTHEGAGEPLYKNLNLDIPAKQSIAIMGGAGSGKSTCVKLLTRFLQMQEGQILINGVPIAELDVNDLRKYIIMVPQHPILFNRTLWENLTYGLEEDSVKKEDVYRIMRENGMTDMEQVYRDKMDQPVGKHGSNLSGGQRQVVTLVRCMLRPSSVIILDEPTSALDERSRRNVEKMIKALSKTRTLIAITHDKELLQHMDRMIYFDKGRIVQDEMLRSDKSQQ